MSVKIINNNTLTLPSLLLESIINFIIYYFHDLVLFILPRNTTCFRLQILTKMIQEQNDFSYSIERDSKNLKGVPERDSLHFLKRGKLVWVSFKVISTYCACA